MSYEWGTFSMEFMPDSVGSHEISITILAAGLTRVHVLITDPLKRDGKRMTGF